MRSDETHPISDWKYEVANGDTRLGYDDWLVRQHEIDEEDKE